MIIPEQKSGLWPSGLVAFGLAFFLICGSCGHTRKDDEALVATLETLARLAEAKDLDAMMSYISADFVDFQGRTKDGLRSLLSSYFTNRTAIVVHRLSTQVEAIEANRAVVETEVAVSSGPAKALRRLVKIAPDIYRIKVRFGREGEDWLILYAAWAAVEISDLLPESLAILKKLFPGI